MRLLHVIVGLGLFAIAAYSLVYSLKREDLPSDRWKVLTVFAGLLLAFVLFTGFIQLGSRHTVHQFIIVKLGATVGGGVVLLLGLVSRMKGIAGRFVQSVAFSLSIVLFGVSFALALMV